MADLVVYEDQWTLGEAALSLAPPFSLLDIRAIPAASCRRIMRNNWMRRIMLHHYSLAEIVGVQYDLSIFRG